ncbi:FAD-dependent monooxygenase [Streptomyces sp. NPDC053367]|uniref:FAD-dependent monooxygenase n=1 Tax=Streptomyces sp. NPDC053367 TaxID=3365700 RepID=UPI0037D66A1A
MRDVLIVGAGPTGLALGIDLARRGVDALVVDKADELFPGSRGKGYPDSPLTEDTRTEPAGTVRAGDRAPDGETAAGKRLFDVLRGPHWTLLAVGTDAALPPLGVPEARIAGHSDQGAYGRGVFLIRPDGYVGWAGETAAGLTEYARRVGVTG